jgi:kynurenine formamidase
MRFVDLSVPLDNNRDWAPRWARNKVKHQSHRFGRFAIRMLFGLPAKYLKTGLGWANETIHLSTHGTTHVDAPWHYGPECEGRRSPTIDELPLDRFYGPGVVLDISDIESTGAASLEDIQRALSKIDHELQPGDIVLMHTGNDKLLGKPAYFSSGPGISAAATRWILDQGVKLTGIDAWGWDAPLRHQAEEAKRTDRRDLFWEAHFVGLEKEYCHMERLANLDQLPSKGFTVCAFPLKVKGGSAGPARVVALIDD